MNTYICKYIITCIVIRTGYWISENALHVNRRWFQSKRLCSCCFGLVVEVTDELDQVKVQTGAPLVLLAHAQTGWVVGNKLSLVCVTQ